MHAFFCLMGINADSVAYSVDVTSANHSYGYHMLSRYLMPSLSAKIFVLQTAVACGDLTQGITSVSISGEILNLVNAINDMVDQLAIFAAEVYPINFSKAAPDAECHIGSVTDTGVGYRPC